MFVYYKPSKNILFKSRKNIYKPQFGTSLKTFDVFIVNSINLYTSEKIKYIYWLQIYYNIRVGLNDFFK